MFRLNRGRGLNRRNTVMANISTTTECPTHSRLNLVSQQRKLCNIFIFGMGYCLPKHAITSTYRFSKIRNFVQ